MVLWEIALGTAYFLGLKRTYKHALRIQRRLVSPKYPKIRQFLHGRTRTVFDATLKIHREIQKRDLEVGRNLGNWVLRWLDKMKPAAQIRAVGSTPLQSASSTTRMPTRQLLEAYRQKTLGGFRYRETGRRLVTSSRNLWHTTYPTVAKLLRRRNPLASNIQYRQLGLITVSARHETMAMQTGLGLSKIFILMGAGFTGAILLKNGKLADLLGELQSLVKEYVGKKRNGADDERADAITNQVHRLAMEVRQLASPRPITVVNESSSVCITSLVGPVIALGAVGYGYMWWKRLTFSDLMYVTRHSMANAVSNLSNNLEHVTDAIAAAKRHLIQRIENLEGRMDKQVEISKLHLEQSSEVRDKLSSASNEVELLCNRLSRMDGRVMTIDERRLICFFEDKIRKKQLMLVCGTCATRIMKIPSLAGHRVTGKFLAY
nr:lipoyl synthase [Tanacetum cinerariifolium]